MNRIEMNRIEMNRRVRNPDVCKENTLFIFFQSRPTTGIYLKRFSWLISSRYPSYWQVCQALAIRRKQPWQQPSHRFLVRVLQHLQRMGLVRFLPLLFVYIGLVGVGGVLLKIERTLVFVE